MVDAVAFPGSARPLVVIVAVIAQQEVEDAQQKRAAAARDVSEAHLRDLIGRPAGDQLSNGVMTMYRTIYSGV
jgi:hypothetical protein